MMSENKIIIPLNAHKNVDFLLKVGDKLRGRGYTVRYIPQNRYILRTAEEKILNHQLYSRYIDHKIIEDFDQLCTKYEVESPKELVFPQMVYDRSYDAPSYRPYWLSGTTPLDYDHYLQLLHRTLDFFDTLFDNGEGGIPLQYQGAEVLRRALQRVADYHGYQSVRTSFSPVPGKILIRSTDSMSFPALAKATYEEMSPKERKVARDYRETFVDDQKQIMEDTPKKEPLARNIRRKIQRIQEYKFNVFPVAANWFRLRFIKRALGTVSRRMYMSERSSREFIESNRYIFYPIQFFQESRVSMRAPEFYNQLWLIEYLSRSLPLGYELVVKDHPQQLGALPLSQVRRINRYATVIAPTIPAREVIPHADAVVTLNNTVGYEGVMYGKPVLTLGDAFYSDAGYTHDVINFRSLLEELNSAVSSDGLSDEEVIEFAHGILESSYSGLWGDSSPDNVNTFVESVNRYIKA